MRNRFAHVAAVALIASLAVVGCKKKEEPVATTPPPAAEPAPMPTTPAPAATASVTAVDLGTAVGADKKVSMPAATFKPKDTIIAAVSTSTSDPAAAVTGKLSAKWSFQDGQVVNDESRDFSLTGSDVTDFQIAKPDGFPAGKYKVEIALDGNVVQSREFEVK